MTQEDGPGMNSQRELLATMVMHHISEETAQELINAALNEKVDEIVARLRAQYPEHTECPGGYVNPHRVINKILDMKEVA